MSDSLFSDVVTRGIRLLRALFSVHMEVAQQEAADDLARLLSGVALLAFAVLLALFGLALLDLSVVVLLAQRSTLLWWQALLGVAGANALLAVFLAFLGRRKLKKPMLKRTRGLVKRTVSAFTEAPANG